MTEKKKEVIKKTPSVNVMLKKRESVYGMSVSTLHRYPHHGGGRVEGGEGGGALRGGEGERRRGREGKEKRGRSGEGGDGEERR